MLLFYLLKDQALKEVVFKFGHCKAHNPIIAAIDLGTNSCRLLVASVDVANLRPYIKNVVAQEVFKPAWRVVDSFAQIIRLGEGLTTSLELSDVAIERAIEAMSSCKTKLSHYDIFELRAVATEACRRARNSPSFLNKVQKETGIKLEIISTEEEGRLAVAGCTGVITQNLPYGLVFDIGGGSTEIVWFKLIKNKKKKIGTPVPFSIIASTSIPYGVVINSEDFREDNPKIIEMHTQLREEVYLKTKEFMNSNGINKFLRETQLIGSSGTVTTLAAIGAGLKKYERKFIDGMLFKTESFHRVSQILLFMNQKERQVYNSIGRGRWDLIFSGSAILEGILDAIPIHRIKIADRGVREGILFDLLSNYCSTNEHLNF